MAEISLVCVREDTWKADLLSDALLRYGFSICRSASVFEDTQGYAAVIVLLSPGAARSELVMQTAARALDRGKLIPVFVNLCHLPDRLTGVAMHDLSQWDGQAEDRVVTAIAYHAQRMAGLSGKPALGAPSGRLVGPQATNIPLPGYFEAPQQAYLEQPRATPNYAYDPYQAEYQAFHQANHHLNQLQIGFQDNASYEPYDQGQQNRTYQPPEPYFVATAHNELDAYQMPAQPGYVSPLDARIAASVSEAAQRRTYFMERAAFADSRAAVEYAQDGDPEPPPRQRRPPSSVFTVMISVLALMGMAYMEEARTREIQIFRATPAEATAILTTPAGIDLTATPRQEIKRAAPDASSPAP
jgi:hypothetical protein